MHCPVLGSCEHVTSGRMRTCTPFDHDRERGECHKPTLPDVVKVAVHGYGMGSPMGFHPFMLQLFGVGSSVTFHVIRYIY